MNIENIINAIRDSQVRITDHADEEAFDDALTYEEIYSSVIQGEIISVWAYNPENLWAVLITVYRPDTKRWIDWKVRVKNEAI